MPPVSNSPASPGWREANWRSVRIAWWSGHSHGRYAGSTWYADTFGLDLIEHCVAQVNCDSPGCRWATEYRDVSWTPELGAFTQAVIRDVTGLPARATTRSATSASPAR